ncbi:MAG: DNA alkylation repair protein [Bacteroidetes bacterium]|nr:DNA alkylation repair protein [Bacteroidota bacterium]
MTTKEILKQLESLGSEQTKKILLKHGAREPVYGVKVEDMKKLVKQVKENKNKTAIELFHTGIYDAVYLAGLIGDGSGMSKKELQDMAKASKGGWGSEYAIPWLATESPYTLELALEWIDSKTETIATCGWCTLSSMVACTEDEKLDTVLLKKLLARVEKEIHKAPNRVRYTMNGYLVALGCFVKDLTDDVIAACKRIGPVSVDMNGTACKVPLATDYITKLKAKNALGKKRKNIKC